MSSNVISARELLLSGVHFGHRVSRWNPKMRPFIYGSRNLIHIIDIRATLTGLLKATHFLENLASQNHLILFVGTKRQASSVIEKEARRVGMPFVAQRWIGGSLTNYTTIRQRLRRLEEIERWEQDGTMSRYNKKEISKIMREKRKLIRNLEGIRTMDRLPRALLIVDPQQEGIAVAEANKIGAVTIALIDTDGDPDKIDIPIPGNDDSMKVIQIIISKLADAVHAGRGRALGSEVAPTATPPKPPPQMPDVISVGRKDLQRGGRFAGGRPPRRDTKSRQEASPVPTPKES